MEQNNYQSIGNIDSILQYIESMDAFHDYPIGNISYDVSTSILSISIEEVLEGEDWPKESNGRVWFLNFGNIQDMKLDIDVPSGLWISDMYVNGSGYFVIEFDQGSIAVAPNAIELLVPKAEKDDSLLPSNSADAPLNMKEMFNDLKNSIAGRKANTEEGGEASEEPTPVNTAPVDNPFRTQAATPAAPATAPAPTPTPAPAAAPAPASPNIQAAPAAVPATPAAPAAPAAPQGNPFLKDPNFVPLQPTTPTPPPKAPDPPAVGPVFG